VNIAKQARDFYLSSKELPLMSKPVLLHYTFEKLANILALVTFTEPYSNVHGLKYRRGEPIKINLNGLFSIFHDCYSEDPSIYLEGYEFELEDVVNAGKIHYIELEDLMAKGSLSTNVITIITAQKTQKRVNLHEYPGGDW
jgi:hypothetical protein